MTTRPTEKEIEGYVLLALRDRRRKCFRTLRRLVTSINSNVSDIEITQAAWRLMGRRKVWMTKTMKVTRRKCLDCHY